MHYVPPPTSSPVDHLAQSLDSCCLQPIGKGSSRVFLTPSRKVAPDGKPVEVQLACVFDCLKKECSAALNQVFHYVHQRLAPAGSILGEYEKKVTELGALDETIKTAWDKAKGLYEHIPFIDNADSKVAALFSVLDIEVQAEALAAKSKALAAQLDESHAGALEYYKKVVIECENLAGTTEEMAVELSGIVDRLEKDVALPPPEVLDLLFLYIRYTIYSIRKDIPDAKSIHHNTLAQLDLRVKSKISKFYVDLDDPKQEDPTELENACRAASSGVVLPSANKFRGDPWGKKVTTLPYLGRYYSISTHIDTLEAIAKAIVRMEGVFQDRIASASREYIADKTSLDALVKVLEEDCTKCFGIEWLIGAQFRRLKEVPRAGQVHAGWNYASSLLTQAKVLRFSIIAFRQKAAEFGSYAHAITMLKQCIKQPAVSSEVSSCYRLLAAVKSACAVPSEFTDSRVYTVLKETIGQIGFRTLALTLQEKEVAKLGPWDITKPDSSHQTYLIKGMMRFLYFPMGEKRTFDWEFQRVFYTLKYDPLYKDAFAACIKGSSEFRSLHDAFIGKHELLYSYLIKSQLKSGAEEKSDAIAGISSCVEADNFEEISLVGVVKTLVYRWVLLHFGEYVKQPKPQGLFRKLAAEFDSSRLEISKHQQTLLTNLFVEYGSDSVQKQFWDDQYGQEYMDKASKAFEQQFPK